MELLIFLVLLFSHGIVLLMTFVLCEFKCKNKMLKEKQLWNKRKRQKKFIPYTPFKSVIPLSKRM